MRGYDTIEEELREDQGGGTCVVCKITGCNYYRFSHSLNKGYCSRKYITINEDGNCETGR